MYDNKKEPRGYIVYDKKELRVLWGKREVTKKRRLWKK